MKKTYLNSFCARCLTLLVLALLSTNLAWGEEKTITLTYESFELTTSYAKKTATIDGIGFTIDQGYKGTNNVIQMNSSKGSGILYNTTAITGLKSIKVNVSSGSKTYTVYTGTSSQPTISAGTGSSTSTINVKNSGDSYFKLSVSGASYFSSIVITYEEGTTPIGPSLSVSPTTIDFGEVYQNAEVEAQDVTVSFSNLTTNDVAAAISGSVFSINKTSSFTSGDKITITPNTTTLGEYSETLTVSATGMESKEVTVTMNVIPAPVTKNYTLVTDASTLKDGNVIVLGAVKDDNWYVNGGINGKYLDSKDATCEDGILESSDAVEITLKETTGGWYLKIGETYINTTAEKALTFADEASTAWTISIDENGDATIAAGDNGRFLYNATSPRFLNYTSKTSASMLLPQIYRKEVSAKITSTGYATFSSDYALDLSNLPEGLTAYKATTAGNGKVHMVAVEEAVAANTGLFLKGAAGKTYTIPVAASGNALDDNLLKATTGESLAEGDYVYVISSGAFQPLGKATVVSKGKAYIPASAITTSGKLEISFGESTGITSYENDNDNENIYNLNGVRVNGNFKGIVIMNGKKYINK